MQAAVRQRPLPITMKVGLNGTGNAFGMRGSVFGRGLDKQVSYVCEVVRSVLAAGSTVRVNAFGLSRGGIGALLLASALSKGEFAGLVDVCLLLHDPVPGNLVSSSVVPMPGRVGLARKSRDVSDAHAIRRVLSFYPVVPMPKIYFHAPMLPVYPRSADVLEYATPGVHQLAFMPQDFFVEGVLHAEPAALASATTYLLSRRFLASEGTPFCPAHPPMLGSPSSAGCDPGTWEELLEGLCLDASDTLVYNARGKTRRGAHGAGAAVRTDAAGARYLNLFHADLAHRLRGGPRDGIQLMYVDRKDEDGSRHLEAGRGVLP
eukprot:TRINITY_DN24798_c0_g1_i1.p1 TRINITY_DN24798_c0_g1~~TRINITY_DN24798_c0_g1_i1.p1  ORF type:complete len:373 (+),score=106.26 TRINITY_DN24798_c0_g1_i1:165-1121(+)